MLCRMRRLECLDGLRGVLACYVMLSHTLPFAPLPAWLLWLFQHGGAGVDVFFILSGLVIVQSLASYSYRPRPFLIARVARIYPVFLVVFAFAVAVQPLATGFDRMAWIAPDSQARFIWSGGWPSDWGMFIATHLTMTHGLFPNGVLPDVWMGFLGAAWSLSTEWQFYLLALLIGVRLGLRRWPGCSWRLRRPRSPGRRWRRSRGSSAAPSCRTRRSTSPWASPARSWCGKAARALVPTCSFSAPRWCCAWPEAAPRRCCRRWSGRRVWRRNCCAPVRLPAARGRSNGRFVSWRRRCGRALWSGWEPCRYGIYLANEPVQKLLGVGIAIAVRGDGRLFTALWLPAAIALPVLAAWALHRWIEVPALRHGRTIARRSMTPAAAPVSAG